MAGMEALVDQAAEFIRSNAFWAGPIVFLLTFGESMLVLGVLVPATALLLMTGGLIGSGNLPILPILLWGYAGAILGDLLSFWIGKWLGPSVLRWRILKRHRTTVARARLFFYRYGFFAVLVGRFLGPMRCTVPTVAGVMGMPELRFQAANVLSAIIWVPALLAPGFLAVRSVDAALQSPSVMVYGIAALCVGIGLTTVLIISRRKTPQERRHRPDRHGPSPHSTSPGPVKHEKR